MAAQTWSTTEVGPPQQFGFWRDAVCEAILNVGVSRDDDGAFAGAISSRDVGELRFARFAAGDHVITRTPTHIRRSPADRYMISLQLGGRAEIAQEDERVTLAPGEVAILDESRPFSIAFPEPVRRLLVIVPRQALGARAPWLRRASLHHLRLRGPLGDVARHHLSALADADTADDVEAQVLTEGLCNLLALATGRSDASAHRGPTPDMPDILAFARSRLTDPALSAAAIAEQFGLSVRTVHLRFERIGTTFGRWVLDQRLEGARRTLMSSSPRHRISDVAFAWGFSDLSHFNRTFKRRFGASPRTLAGEVCAS